MSRIDPKLAATLRQPAELVARGLAPLSALAELERVAARYAIAVTPEIAALIGPADPARVSAEMVSALKVEGATTWVAVHANHPREFSDAARAACARFADAGIPLVSQSVLLRGVNDAAATLEALMRTFVELRIKPY